MAFDQINNGTHGRYPLPVGMVIRLMPTGPSSSARATSSVSGLGSWMATAPIVIGPFPVFTEIVVEVLTGVALVEVVFPTGSAPVTISGTAGIGNTLMSQLAMGWSVTNYQWLRNGNPISGATSPSYTQISSDAGSVITLSVAGLTYTPPGIAVPGTIVVWDDTLVWDDNSIWVD